MKHKKTLLAALPLLLISFFLLGAEKPADTDNQSIPEKQIAKMIYRKLPGMHLNREKIDMNTASNAVEQLLSTFDYSRIYFMQNDVEQFRAQAAQLPEQLKNGDTSFIDSMFETLLNRVSNRVDYVGQLLEKGFDTGRDETYTWKRKDLPWAADEAEWNDLWRRRIKSEYISRLISERLSEENASAQTNETAAAETAAVDDEEQVSPEEFVLEYYRQYLTLLQDYDHEWLFERYLNAFTSVYDPHTSYMSPTSVEDFKIDMKLSLVGIGAMLQTDEGMAKIARVIKGGPADRDGRLQAGDKIIAVAQGDEEPVSILHWPLRKTVRLIRGEKDTKVVLTVIPASDVTGARTKKIDLIRDEVKLEEQAAKGTVKESVRNGVTNRVGIITLPDFYMDMDAIRDDPLSARSCSRDVKRIIGDLKKQNICGMILDLRNNGGGSLEEALNITGFFIPSGPVVQVMQRRWGVQVLPDADPDVLYEGPLTVLVNRLSASASEIVAAALQDYGRALIVGDSKTHGKGTVQTLSPLGGNEDAYGSLKVTTATFYRIAGGSTQKKGVIPDVIIPDALDYMDIGEDTLPHALEWNEVGSAIYKKSHWIQTVLPDLLTLSEKRRQENEKFKTYFERLEKQKKLLTEGTLPLNFEKRLEMTREEKELDDIQYGQINGITEEEDDDIQRYDIVLEESLNIMTDLINLNHRRLANK